jgi:hypothetical protein
MWLVVTIPVPVSTAIAKQMHATRTASDLLLLNIPVRAIEISLIGRGAAGRKGVGTKRLRV